MTILQQILAKRGIKTKKETAEFLNPAKPETFTANDFGVTKTGLKKAVDRIQKAVENNEPIFIHGDYDVDGICSTAILWETIYFNLSYQNAFPFIPHRIEHGYGLTIQSIDEIAKRRGSDNKALIITLDCGITNFAEIDYAKSKNFDVIVLDHHEKDKKLPKACAILHTNKVCATTLAWFLTQVLQGHTCPDLTSGYTAPPAGGAFPSRCDLDLVALATIADLEPLTGLNRSFAKYGLEELNQTPRIGLQELIRIAGIENRKIGTYEVGWMLGPRLNAMGRLESALDSLRLLCTRDRARAKELAQKLNEANYQRQEMTKKAVEQARQIATDSYIQTPNPSLLVITHPEWHEGIIGLIASKMTEEFGRPTLAISIGETVSKGSARSIEGFNLVENLRLHQDLLINVGGHPMAAGLTIETAKITELTDRFKEGNTKRCELRTARAVRREAEPRQGGVKEGRTFQEKEEQARPLKKSEKVDLKLNLTDINFDLYQQLQQLEPFGLGNPQPLFQTNGLIINDLRLVGKESQHLKLKVGNDKTNILDGIGFNLGSWAERLNINDKINLIYYLEKDDFNGNQKIQLRIKTIEKV